MILPYLFWFITIWITSFFMHEYMHVLEHLRQGGHSYHIELYRWHGIPSMRVYLSGIQRAPWRVHLAGGLYTSILHLLVICIYIMLYGFRQSGFTYSLICIGLIQHCYGWFEMLNIDVMDRDDYMKVHYFLYMWCWIFVSLLWFWRLGVI